KRNFSDRNFKERLKELKDIEAEEEKKEAASSTPAASAAFDKATAKFVGRYWIRLLFNDAKKERWFELYVASRDLSKPAINNFLESFKIGQQTEGIEIGKGAPANFGDASETVEQKAVEQKTVEQKPKINPGGGEGNGDDGGSPNANVGDGQNKNVISEPIIIVFKPRANYTDAARQSNIQGTVRLRVTFLANGGIGSVGVISALSHGLTEQAMAAAKNLFFLPARRNGVKHSITKVVEYQFSLY
ncbi:MAG TPA: TonB family protein, partial [Pyrinomonadaceae bacterium]|nr:TonB family protein [Pyrinomonadaceae bacterium]